MNYFYTRETLKGLKKLVEFLAVFPRPTAERKTRKQKDPEILRTSAQLLSSCQPLGRAGRVNRAPHLRPHPTSSLQIAIERSQLKLLHFAPRAPAKESKVCGSREGRRKSEGPGA